MYLLRTRYEIDAARSVLVDEDEYSIFNVLHATEYHVGATKLLEFTSANCDNTRHAITQEIGLAKLLILYTQRCSDVRQDQW